MKRTLSVFLTIALIISLISLKAFAGNRGELNGDGDIDSLDASLILQYDVGLITLSAAQLALADLNADGAVDFLDASMILQYDAGLIGSFGGEASESSVEISSEESSEGDSSKEESSEPEPEDPRTIITFGRSISIKGNGATLSGRTVTINSAGEYLAKGSTSDGAIEINVGLTDAVSLTLSNLTLENGSGPAIFVNNASDMEIILEASTTSTLKDGSSYDANWVEKKAALFSNDDVRISGSGTLELYGNAAHGLVSDDGVLIRGGTVKVVSAISDGIRANDFVTIDGGEFIVTSCGSDGIECGGTVNISSGRTTVNASAGVGIKSEQTIEVSGGSLDIVSTKDGMRAENTTLTGAVTVSGGSIKITTACDGIQCDKAINIIDGILDFTCGGGSGVTTTDSAKGLKCATLDISGGVVGLNCADDAIKTTGNAVISGGNLTVSATLDGIQCGGELRTSGCEISVISAGGSGNASIESSKGLKGESIIIESGQYTLNCADDSMNSNGAISISGGNFDIDSATDGIQAETSLLVSGGSFELLCGGGSGVLKGDSNKGLKGASVTISGGTFDIDSADDAVNSKGNLTVSGSAALNIKSGDDALHADGNITINGGNIDVAKAGEGLEANNVTVSGGTIMLVTGKDGVNVGGGADGSGDNAGSGSQTFSMGGGSLTIRSGEDAIDSYASIYISGGTLIGSAGEDAFGIGTSGSLNINGGIVSVSGNREIIAPANASTQLSIVIDNQSGGGFEIKKSDGSKIAEMNSASYQFALISSPDVIAGETYSIYKSGASVPSGSGKFKEAALLTKKFIFIAIS